ATLSWMGCRRDSCWEGAGNGDSCQRLSSQRLLLGAVVASRSARGRRDGASVSRPRLCSARHGCLGARNTSVGRHPAVPNRVVECVLTGGSTETGPGRICCRLECVGFVKPRCR